MADGVYDLTLFVLDIKKLHLFKIDIHSIFTPTCMNILYQQLTTFLNLSFLGDERFVEMQKETNKQD